MDHHLVGIATEIKGGGYLGIPLEFSVLLRENALNKLKFCMEVVPMKVV